MSVSERGSPTLVFVEASQTGSGLAHMRWAISRGWHILFVSDDPGKYGELPGAETLRLLADAGQLRVVAQTGTPEPPESLVREIGAIAGPKGVIAVTDRHLEFAAALAASAGSSFLSPSAVSCLRDKRRARSLFGELGLPAVRWLDAATPAAVEAFAAEVGAPVVLKNSRGTGSLDVELCLTPSEARETFSRMLSRARYLDGPLMAEEFLLGPLVSLEVLVVDGVPLALGVTDRQLGPLPHFCEVSYTFPVDLPADLLAAMQRTVSAIVGHLQMAHGFLHVEFIVTAQGPKLVEVNARLGGGLLAGMLDDCLTRPTAQLLAEAALGAVNEAPQRNGRFSSTVTVYANRECELRGLACIERARSIPFVREVVVCARPGASLKAARDYRGAVCQIRSTAGSPALAFNSAQTARLLVLHELERSS